MFGLVKLAAYALLGYAIYEVMIGVTTTAQAGPAGGGGGGDQSQRGGPRQQGGQQRGQNSGLVARVPVQDSTGAARSERVGRGVIRS